jgi:hypothetical protein
LLPVLAAMIPMIGLPADGLAGLFSWPLRPDESPGATAIAFGLLMAESFSVAVMDTGESVIRAGRPSRT